MQSLENCQALTALPGFGKSTIIANKAKKGDLVVAMTSIATQSLR